MPRVVALTGAAELDALLALGVYPSAAARPYGEVLPWTAEAGGMAVPVLPSGDGHAPNLDAVRALRPDVIVGYHNVVAGRTRAALEEIAPVVAVPHEDWSETVRLLGAAFDRHEEAAAVLERTQLAITEQRLAIRSSLPPGPTITFTGFLPTGLPAVLAGGAGASRLAVALGLQLVPGLEVGAEVRRMTDEQREVFLGADIIIGFDYGPAAAAGFEELEADQAFQTLPAVRDGGYLRVDGHRAQALFVTVLSVPAAVEVIAQAARARFVPAPAS